MGIPIKGVRHPVWKLARSKGAAASGSIWLFVATSSVSAESASNAPILLYYIVETAKINSDHSRIGTVIHVDERPFLSG